MCDVWGKGVHLMPPKGRKLLEVKRRGNSGPGPVLPPEPEPEAVRTLDGVQEELYLGQYASREELEREIGTFWDATTAGRYAWCPRHAQYASLGLEPSGESLQLDAGNAIHAAMHTLYTSGDGELALHVLRQTFGEDRSLPAPSAKYSHINVGFLEVVFKNYLTWREKHDTFEPLLVHYEDLDLSQVAAAMWQVLPDGRVILGESKLVMRLDVDGDEFIYAGKPDLPILMGGGLYIMDHKTSCGGYLSQWWAEKHTISNQLRGYCRMIELVASKVLAQAGQQRVQGAIINGIYAGEKATDPKFRGTSFSRFGPFLYRPSHLDEAIVNQWWWLKMRHLYAETADASPALRKYGWGQNTGKACQGCPYLDLCREQPAARRGVIQTKYSRKERSFLDL
jgi:hypothetical protein